MGNSGRKARLYAAEQAFLGVLPRKILGNFVNQALSDCKKRLGMRCPAPLWHMLAGIPV